MMRMFAPLSSASSIGLAAPASNALVCCGKLENRYPRSNVPTRGTRLAEIDDAELDGIDDVDLLAQLVVGKECDFDLLTKPIGLKILDQVLIIDAAVGEFGIVGLRRRQFELHGRGFRTSDKGRCCGEPGGRSRRRLQDDTSANE